MPIGRWGTDDIPLLSGMFGAFQSLAAQYADTQSIWTTLRLNAATWQFQAQGGGALPPEEQLLATGAQILSENGVGATQVGAYRSIAGQWRSAKGNLQAANPDQQITADMIFQPPWAQTLGSDVPSRYRLRVEWQAESAAGEEFTTWGTYELDTPLTSIADALDQAQTLVGKKPTSDTPLGSSIVGVNDYELEQI